MDCYIFVISLIKYFYYIYFFQTLLFFFFFKFIYYLCENRAGSNTEMNRAKRRRLEKSLAKFIQQHKLDFWEQSTCPQTELRCYNKITWDGPWHGLEEGVLHYFAFSTIIYLCHIGILYCYCVKNRKICRH